MGPPSALPIGGSAPVAHELFRGANAGPTAESARSGAACTEWPPDGRGGAPGAGSRSPRCALMRALPGSIWRVEESFMEAGGAEQFDLIVVGGGPGGSTLAT